MPDDVDVQKALVVGDDDVVYALWNVFCPLDRDFNAEKLENNVPEGESANLGAVFPVPADTAIEGVNRLFLLHTHKYALVIPDLIGNLLFP